MKKVLLAVPCYNEEARFSFEYWKEICETLVDVDFIFVDDGSTDDTFDLINKMNNFSNCKVVKNHKNLGKALTIVNIFTQQNLTNYDVFGFIDSDGAFSLEDIHFNIMRSHEILKDSKYEALFSSRIQLAGRSIKRKRIRHYISRVIYTILNFKLNLGLYDTQSGFKLYKNTQTWKDVFNQQLRTKWFLDIESILIYRKIFRRDPIIWEEPLSTWSEMVGSKIKFRDFFKIIREMLILIFKY